MRNKFGFGCCVVPSSSSSSSIVSSSSSSSVPQTCYCGREFGGEIYARMTISGLLSSYYSADGDNGNPYNLTGLNQYNGEYVLKWSIPEDCDRPPVFPTVYVNETIGYKRDGVARTGTSGMRLGGPAIFGKGFEAVLDFGANNPTSAGFGKNNFFANGSPCDDPAIVGVVTTQTAYVLFVHTDPFGNRVVSNYEFTMQYSWILL